MAVTPEQMDAFIDNFEIKLIADNSKGLAPELATRTFLVRPKQPLDPSKPSPATILQPFLNDPDYGVTQLHVDTASATGAFQPCLFHCNGTNCPRITAASIRVWT